MPEKPHQKPKNSNFSSGPCAKRPGWSAERLRLDTLGRSHRSALGKKLLQDVIDRSKSLLRLPADYQIGIVPGSDTGAVEMALWNLLTGRFTAQHGVDVFSWESFSAQWKTDILGQLKIPNARSFHAEFGQLPDLSQANFDGDVVFAWNGTTSGVCVGGGEWIPDARNGLTICDGTSAVFGMPIDWRKIDVGTYSWQKSMGGEAAHGMLILSPRAVARLESDPPTIPIPKLFQLLKKGKVDSEIFSGSTINTPSLLCAADAWDALEWIAANGGVEGMISRCDRNFRVIENWVARSNSFAFLCEEPRARSHTSICLQFKDVALTPDARSAVAKGICALLETESVAHDINAYRDAPPGLRIWCGPTIEATDIEFLLPWIDWAYETTRKDVR